MLNNLTILLTIKGRDEFTYRFLNYLDFNKCPYKIIIADGGCSTDLEYKLRSGKLYNFINIQYIKFPFDATPNIYLQKLKNALDYVNTEYLILADNDDFFDLANISNIIDFLNNSPDYVSCSGITEHLYLYQYNELKGLPVVNSDYLLVSTSAKNKSIVDDDPLLRINYFIKNVEKHELWYKYYAVTRTESVVKCLKSFIPRGDVDLNSLEIYFNLMLLYEGKHKVLQFPYYIRQHGTSQLTAELNKVGSLYHRFYYGNSIDDISDSLINFGISNHDKSYGLILTGINEWINTYKDESFRHNKSYLIKKYLLKFLPFNVYKFIYKASFFANNFFGREYKEINLCPIIEPHVLIRY